MAFARIQGRKIVVLHNTREGGCVRQRRLHAFDTPGDVRDILASEHAWKTFCDSLDVVLQGQSRVNRAKLKTQLEMLASNAPEENQRKADTMAGVAARLADMLAALEKPLRPAAKKALARARDRLDVCHKLIEEKLSVLDREEDDGMELDCTEWTDSQEQHCLEDGLERYRKGEWSAAKSLFLRGLKHAPEHVDLLVHAGLCELVASNRDIALAHFDRAMTIGQREADRLITRTPRFVKHEDIDQFAGDADDPVARRDGGVELGMVLDGDEPTRLYRHLEFRPFFRAMTNKAVVLMDMGRYTEAIDTLMLCRSYDPLDGTANMVGICHLNLGEVDQAAEWYVEMLWPEARYVGALIQFLRGNLDRAVRHLLTGIPWNQHIARMIVGTEKPLDVRYVGQGLPPAIAASEFAHRDGHLFRKHPRVRDLVRCVVEDEQIAPLLKQVERAVERRNNEREYRMPQDLFHHWTGSPNKSFLDLHAPRLVKCYGQPGGPYWQPQPEDTLTLTVLKQNSSNWLVNLSEGGMAFYFRPRNPPANDLQGTDIEISVIKSWRHRRRLFVSGAVVSSP